MKKIGEFPAMLPLDYALLGDDMIFRTGPGTKLRAATTQTLTSFEVDATSPDDTSGWSVLVVGHAREIRGRTTPAAAEQLGIRPCAPGARDKCVKITSGRVSGRAFGDVELG